MTQEFALLTMPTALKLLSRPSRYFFHLAVMLGDMRMHLLVEKTTDTYLPVEMIHRRVVPIL